MRNADSTIQKNVNISEEHYNKKSLIRPKTDRYQSIYYIGICDNIVIVIDHV